MFSTLGVLAYVERHGTKYEVGEVSGAEALREGETVHMLSIAHHLTTASITVPFDGYYAVTVINGRHGGAMCNTIPGAWLMASQLCCEGPRGQLPA